MFHARETIRARFELKIAQRPANCASWLKSIVPNSIGGKLGNG
jgi:hypothetical protein